MNQNAQQEIEPYVDYQPEVQIDEKPDLKVVPPLTEQEEKEEFEKIQRAGNVSARATRRREREEMIMPLVGMVAMSGPIGFAAMVGWTPFVEAWINQD